MPHLFLEYTDNIAEPDLVELFQRCHASLVKSLPTALENCKSRAQKQSQYSIGDGNSNNAFVSLLVKIMAGRSAEIQQAAGHELLEILKSTFAASLKKLNCQITVEIVEISDHYFKL